MGQEMIKSTWLILALSLMTACSPQATEPTSAPEPVSTPDPVVQFDPDRLKAIADVFATTPSELVSSLMAANDAKIEELRVTKKEYVCTPEMFESREANSMAAQEEWNVMRGAE
jgi:hypothetical protein